MIKAAILSFLLLMLMHSSLLAQKKRNAYGQGVVEMASEPPVIMHTVIQYPEFPGDVRQWIMKHLNYPANARDNGWEGRVQVMFEILPDGTVNFLSIRKSSGVPPLDTETRRLIDSMPRWKPARSNGRNIPFVMVLPIVFRLK